MILDSRQIMYMGINYHTLPMPAIDQHNNLKFQQALLRLGIDVTGGTTQRNQILIGRDPPLSLEIRLIAQATEPRVGQILIIAPTPERPLRHFISEVEAILQAFAQTWPSPNRQILRCDVTLRCLYQSTSKHAFQELWEERLHQPTESLSKLKRQVRGGGLRLVMPLQPGTPEPAQIELKIESFLRDTKKIFVETQLVWPEPKPPGTDFASADKLNQANDYIENEVHAFMMEGES